MTVPKFSDFRNTNDSADKTASPDAAPVGGDAENPEVNPTDTDPSQIPALFATIHHQSDTRPDGYSSDDIERLNNDANAHMKKNPNDQG